MGKSKLKDFDPESLLDPAPSSSDNEFSGSESSDAEDANTGREHYADVGKSKLRKKEVVPLGPQYTGSRISRNAAQDEDSDDPFARGFDGESSEEDSEEDGGLNGVALDRDSLASGEEDESLEGEESLPVEDYESDEGMDDDDIDEDEEDVGEDGSEDDSSDESKDEAAKLRQMMKDTKSLTTTISAAAQSDIAKGQAVKTQRKTFDTLLNTRIRLQKALISTNSMAAGAHRQESPSDSSVEAAEAAALTLLNNLTDLRASLEEARTGQKRKRVVFGSDTPSSELWQSIRDSDFGSVPHRKSVLEKWSSKTRGAALNSNKGRLNASAQQTLTEILNSKLSNSTHLIARTQIPRSCAPLQSAAAKPQPDPAIYDDADFYGLLLKELLEQRSADLNVNGSAEFVVQAPWQVAREAKTKKVVDTKASKGRRLRYTVHEKLQNFMAPEERGDWGERQREELFSSLFGQRLGLGENDDVESEKEDEDMDAEEKGLMLFRS